MVHAGIGHLKVRISILYHLHSGKHLLHRPFVHRHHGPVKPPLLLEMGGK